MISNVESQAHDRDIWSRLHLDPPLVTALGALAVIGLITLYSAGNQDIGLVLRQLTRFAMAFGAMLFVAQLPPQTLQRWAPWLYGLGMLLLFAVLILGEIGKGAQRWLDIGVVRFQPSELMKVAVPMMIAWFLAEVPLPPNLGRTLMAALLFLVPAALVAKQPDLGTALLIACSGAFVLLFAGMPWRYLVFVIILLVPTSIGAWHFALHDYQRQRIITFLDPESDPLGSGYHIIQSKIAIGSGGIYGKGWLNSSQSHLDYLPEPHTDFIFAVFAEEFGLLGIALLLALYLYIIYRCLLIALEAADSFSRLLAGTLTGTFLVYVTVNIGMVSGLLPVVGVPLPLISYGGTSVVTLLVAFGILMSVKTHKKLVKT